jgi:hypothetical protein
MANYERTGPMPVLFTSSNVMMKNYRFVVELLDVHAYILRALIDGATLKAHRYLDGAKLYKLHPLEGLTEPVERETVEYLKKHQLIKSNMKFPAATYLLTEKGKKVAWSVTDADAAAFSARTFTDDASIRPNDGP